MNTALTILLVAAGVAVVLWIANAFFLNEVPRVPRLIINGVVVFVLLFWVLNMLGMFHLADPSPIRVR